MKKVITLFIILLIPLFIVTSTSCGGQKDPADLLEECRRAAESYTLGDGYMHFNQEARYSLATSEGEFNQRITTEGDNIFPDRQGYQYREEISSTKLPGEPQVNSFSYLTLDQGETAFVKGELLSEQLGVQGWIHYTPPSGQNRHFDLQALLERLVRVEGGVEQVGYEDVGGIRCIQLRYAINGQELLELRMQEDPAFEEEYQGMELGDFLEAIQVDLFVGEADNLPRRILIDQPLSMEGGVSGRSYYDITLFGWGEESPVEIEQPAYFTEAG